MKSKKLGLSLIEIVLVLGVILVLYLSIMIYNKIIFEKAINSIVDDVFFSYAGFKEKTAYNNNLKFSGTDGKYIFNSKFPKLNNEKTNYAEIWFGHFYFRTPIGYVMLQTGSVNNITNSTFTYQIVLNGREQQQACIRLIKIFARHDIINKDFSYLPDGSKFNILNNKTNLSMVCKTKNDEKLIHLSLKN